MGGSETAWDGVVEEEGSGEREIRQEEKEGEGVMGEKMGGK